jgi:hypothetical protein
MSAAALESAIRHFRTITAVFPDNATATVNDMVTAGAGCRLIAFFLFIFIFHDNTSTSFCIFCY